MTEADRHALAFLLMALSVLGVVTVIIDRWSSRAAL